MLKTPSLHLTSRVAVAYIVFLFGLTSFLLLAQAATAATPTHTALSFSNISIPVPALDKRVTDLTGTLTSSEQEQLTNKLAALEQRKGAQIAILMIDTTGEDSIEQFATRTFDQWKLGRQGIDDGVLILIAKQDHRMRIEVGYGLEGNIPDTQAGKIIRDTMTPAFKQSNYAKGIDQTVDMLTLLINGEPLPKPEPFEFPLQAYALLIASLIGIISGPILATDLSRWRWLVPTSMVICIALAIGMGGQEKLSTLAITPLCMLCCGTASGPIWEIKKLRYTILGILAYIGIVMLFSQHFGVDAFIYGLGYPAIIFGGVAWFLWCWWLVFTNARKTWKSSRISFFFRLLIVLMFNVLFTCAALLSSAWKMGNNLGLAGMLVGAYSIISAIAFTIANGSLDQNNRKGGRGSSSGKGGFSGGGGSSGGGGASGNW